MFRRLILAAILLTGFSAIASAQTLDEVLDQHFKAMGGLDKLRAVKSMKVTGKMVMGGAMEAPFTVYRARPNHQRVEFTFQGMTGIQAFDGTKGQAWMVMPFMGKKDPEVMPAEESKMMSEEADFDGVLVDWKDKGHKVEYAGKEQVEGADCYKLKVTLKSGEPRVIFLDSESGLEVKREGKRTIRGTEMEFESISGDYKEFDGLVYATVVAQGAKGSPAEQHQKMVMEKFEMNAAVPDSLFAVPKNAVVAKAPEAAKTAEAPKAADKTEKKAEKK
ncbi:MAG: hypothetical protein HOP12_12780 [Candidatus Eisenbacteria bacterium]|uniref:Outer membrane lipoprotein-sorting protein n=1 Tax=Eiseniibacteriota bacterium TaxID=2212470 RepID=A0A849SI11_UNCEI|nr:hypothetical protein [Candidatus Eisenbacteria bacterium]